MPDDSGNDSEALHSARQRRIELKGAVSKVEIATASPSGDPEWRDGLIRELEDLRIALDQHVVEVEADGGLLAELAEDAPRLVNHITQVRDEHPVLTTQVAEALAHVKEGAAVDDVRSEVLEVLLAIARHRQRGADLVYEAYTVDIGGDA